MRHMKWTPVYMGLGPYGLHSIDFRMELARADLNSLAVLVEATGSLNRGYWISLRNAAAADGVSRSCVDAFCAAATKEDCNPAVQWLLDMAAVYKTGMQS